MGNVDSWGGMSTRRQCCLKEGLAIFSINTLFLLDDAVNDDEGDG